MTTSTEDIAQVVVTGGEEPDEQLMLELGNAILRAEQAQETIRDKTAELRAIEAELARQDAAEQRQRETEQHQLRIEQRRQAEEEERQRLAAIAAGMFRGRT